MKKDYMKPTMKVVMLKQRYHILVGSKGARSVNNSEGFTWEDLEGDDV